MLIIIPSLKGNEYVLAAEGDGLLHGIESASAHYLFHIGEQRIGWEISDSFYSFYTKFVGRNQTKFRFHSHAGLKVPGMINQQLYFLAASCMNDQPGGGFCKLPVK